MSLLLKALQNAARNREAAGAERSEPELEPGARATAPSELSLEPVQPTPRGSARAEAAGSDPAGERHAAPGPQYAQSVLRAGAAARTQRLPRHEPGILDWLARRPLVAFSTAAGLFAIGYGIYLYLQLTNPGIFIARPQPPRPSVAAAPPPPQPAAVPRPPAAAPAPAPPLTSSSAAPAPASGPSAASLPTGASPPQPRARAEAGTPGTAPSAGTPSASTSPARGSAPTPPQPSTTPPATTAAAEPATPARTAPERPTAAPDRASAPPAMAARLPRRSEPASAAATIAAAPSAPAAAAGVKMAAVETGTVPPAARSGPPRARPKAPAAAPAELQEGVTTTGTSQVVALDRVVQEAYQALAQGRVDEAERLYRQSLASDARNVDAMLGLAATLAQKHQGEAASQLYMRVLEQDPRNTFAQAGLLNLSGHADPIAAEARLKQLIATEPSAFLYFALGNLYAERGQWAAAQGAYFQAHKLDPDNPDYAFNLAVGLEHLSQPKIALDYYRRAVRLAQARGNAQFELARVENRIRTLESTLAAAP